MGAFAGQSRLAHVYLARTIWWPRVECNPAVYFRSGTRLGGCSANKPFGVAMVGPVLYTFGSEAQKERWLPGIQRGETFWCQGYSEPNAGSDLASLKTRATLNGDHYLVNGQKIWTTQAHWADMMFCLVRTDSTVKQQQGISFLLIDMKTPGIEVRPIYSIDGHHHLNEVYFTDVKVPVENLVGKKGWDGPPSFYLPTNAPPLPVWRIFTTRSIVLKAQSMRYQRKQISSWRHVVWLAWKSILWRWNTPTFAPLLPRMKANRSARNRQG